MAKYHDGRVFKCDQKRKLALSGATLRRHLRTWKRGGELPAAFNLKYRPRRPSVPAPVFVRFAHFCASQPLPSLREAWKQFCRRGGHFGRGKHARRPLTISLNQLHYNFPAADFHLMQAEIKASAAAQTKKAQLLCKVIAEIRRRLPERPPRQRKKTELAYDI